ncbi:hypothetical protein JCM5350_003901 [Sporobolomyces pararoseus]
MDRLPPELLGMIADSIQQDPRPLTAQRTLSRLARTNKILYSICNPRIYRMPVLESRRMVVNWSKFYTSKVNPWAICRGTNDLEKVIVPKSTNKPLHRRLSPLQDPFKSFFLRDLTSVSTSSIAPSGEDFLAALLGPSKPNRRTIKEISIRLSTSRLTLFLLEALSRVECEWNGGVIEDMLDYLDDELLKLFVRRRLTLSKEVDLSLDQLEAVGQLAKKLAPFEFSLFYDMHFGEINFDPENLESIHHSRDVPIYPFNSLSALTIPVDSILQLHLLFYSRSLPSLRCLAIIGTCYLSQTRRHDVKLLRRSITDRNGVIVPPLVEEAARTREPDLFALWDPLTEKEKATSPRIDYIGPNLDTLDLSRFKFDVWP